MILVLDNYDSFTYNLVQYLGELGAAVKVVRNDELGVDAAVALEPERIVISPGPCTPNEAGISLELIRRLAGKVPILGVCLGHQAIGQAFGGKVVHAQHVMHIVSNVEGRCAPGVDALDVFKASFPAGTVTGAPKVRAMQIIDELEPVKRGVYSGAVG